MARTRSIRYLFELWPAIPAPDAIFLDLCQGLAADEDGLRWRAPVAGGLAVRGQQGAGLCAKITLFALLRATCGGHGARRPRVNVRA